MTVSIERYRELTSNFNGTLRDMHNDGDKIHHDCALAVITFEDGHTNLCGLVPYAKFCLNNVDIVNGEFQLMTFSVGGTIQHFNGSSDYTAAVADFNERFPTSTLTLL